MTKQEQFFYDHAGFSVAQGETQEQGKERTAKELAAAETWARHAGVTFQWVDDCDGCIGCDCGQEDCACFSGEEHRCEVCMALDENGMVLASLGSICEASMEYARVVRAELASEAMMEAEVA